MTHATTAIPATLTSRPGARNRSLAALFLRRPSERGVFALLAAAAYAAAAWLIVLVDHSIIGDAWSRVGNAFYVLFSRDPHLAAIGFVWNPLPSIAVMPLLPFAAIWPDLLATGFCASIVSILCMAAAVWHVHGMATDWRVAAQVRIPVVAFFAFNPIIVYYAANGMSEAMFVLTLVMTARYLARWAMSGEVGSLSIAGIALAAAYMTRYEAAAAAIGAALAVLLLTGERTPGSLRTRLEHGFADLLVFGMPFAIAFVAWALASWIIVGDPFQQFSSVYGVASQETVAQSGIAQVTGQGTAAGYVWLARQILALEPGIVLIAGAGAIVALAGGRRRRELLFPTVGVMGAVVAFSIFGFLTGRTLGWLRYFITLIPLAAAIVLAIAARPREAAELDEARRGPRSPEYAVRGGERAARSGVARSIGRRLVTGVAVVAIALSIPGGVVAALDTSLNPLWGGEAFQLRPVVFGWPHDPYLPNGQYNVGRAAAEFVDSLRAPDSTVLVDSAMGFPIVLQSTHPRQFIVTSDRDFQQALADPALFKVRYLFVPEPVGYQSLDAINRAYPGIYDHGAPFVSLVRQFSAGGNSWRLYEVVPQ